MKKMNVVVIRKKRTEKEYKDLINRLSRIEGQIRGIKRMVEEDAYCPDILIQVSAANAKHLTALIKYSFRIIFVLV